MYTVLSHISARWALSSKLALEQVRVKYITFKKYLGIQYSYELG